MNIKEKKITDLHVSIPESAGKDTKLINMNMLAGLGHFYIARQQQKKHAPEHTYKSITLSRLN